MVLEKAFSTQRNNSGILLWICNCSAARVKKSRAFPGFGIILEWKRLPALHGSEYPIIPQLWRRGAFY
jgi:hypothetical protein